MWLHYNRIVDQTYPYTHTHTHTHTLVVIFFVCRMCVCGVSKTHIYVASNETQHRCKSHHIFDTCTLPMNIRHIVNVPWIPKIHIGKSMLL